jgi:NAD(P)-dependent dehydrogenase (short-subunit alcohol dehydrogenase family)
MKVAGRVVAITGGGNGLGADACRQARARGARTVVVVDRDAAAAERVAVEVGGKPVTADVTSEQEIGDTVAAVVADFGHLDIWVHNAGVGAQTTTFTDDQAWQRMWQIHVMSIVYASRALLPRWVERGEGHLAVVASSNALTSNPVSAAYAATKHAELALTEWLQYTYASRGITASCFCPKGMLTPMLLAAADRDDYARSSARTAVTPEEAARMLLDLMESGRFLATTYPPVLEEYRLRSRDPDAYLAMMAALHDDLVPHIGAVPDQAVSGTTP